MRTTLRSLWLLLATLVSFSALAAPKAELWSFWDKHGSSTGISHQAWQDILDKYLVTEGEYTLFRYGQVSQQDKTKLQNYLKALSGVDPRTYTKPEQYAYWVNLYNALTVDLIIKEYPVKSITKLGGLFSFGPWDQELITVQGKELTLNDIEHKILRPIWNDPRTHYAVNCASLGCPNLQTQAFTADNTEALLEQAANTFINSNKGANLKGNSLELSSIYDWFAVDFGGEKRVLAHLAKYRPELADFSGKVRFEYDWNLNQAKTRTWLSEKVFLLSSAISSQH
ncbi:hypothetical protein JCM19232_1694 [Vibrio ishigakensis]|uniref:DUF547 domain-containing protein n=1 Tax=Vibrio ishigakensis TaxID=1481914 RepID=A0A0B8PD69_9VIBR|nr:hypothetical protein JCM19232_1694 [Vibrio ishigakensis]